MISRWSHYAYLDGNVQTLGDQAAAMRAYRECAVRVVRATKDWQSTLVPHLLQLAGREHWPAAVVLIELLTELDPEQQVESVVRAFEGIAVNGKQNFETSIHHLNAWLDDPSHRTAIHRQLEQANGDTGEDLVVGLLRSGLADDVVKQSLTTRFGDDTIKRPEVLEKLIVSFDDQPDLTQVVISLIEHPALDAPANVTVRNGERTETSLRAGTYLHLLKSVLPQHHSSFVPLLQKLAQAGKNGESEAARQVLDAWK